MGYSYTSLLFWCSKFCVSLHHFWQTRSLGQIRGPDIQSSTSCEIPIHTCMYVPYRSVQLNATPDSHRNPHLSSRRDDAMKYRYSLFCVDSRSRVLSSIAESRARPSSALYHVVKSRSHRNSLCGNNGLVVKYAHTEISLNNKH